MVGWDWIIGDIIYVVLERDGGYDDGCKNSDDGTQSNLDLRYRQGEMTRT
jgi:hypothetical protein